MISLKLMIILVFLINCFFAKKYLVELKDKEDEAGDTHSDYSFPSPIVKMEELGE